MYVCRLTWLQQPPLRKAETENNLFIKEIGSHSENRHIGSSICEDSQLRTVPTFITVHTFWHLETLEFPMGGGYQYRDIF